MSSSQDITSAARRPLANIFTWEFPQKGVLGIGITMIIKSWSLCWGPPKA